MNMNRIVNGHVYSRDEDQMWGDDADENAMQAFSYRSARQLSSASPSSPSPYRNNEEHMVHQPQHYSNREDLFLEDRRYEDNRSIENNNSCISSSPYPNSASGSDDTSEVLERSSVIEKIEDFILQTVIEPLTDEPNPSTPVIDVQVDEIDFKRKLSFNHLSQARSLTSIVMVASFCYDLLAPQEMDENESYDDEEEAIYSSFHRQNRHQHIRRRRTTTTREVYYFYVTHFRDQRECDKAIWDLVRMLNLPSRQCLGLVASPKGWFCGSIDVYNAHTNELKFNGRELDSHGMAITPSTYDNPFHRYTRDDSSHLADRSLNEQNSNQIRIESDARCILVIEKEGIYTRLSEDKFFLRYFPCILVTGKGFPDIATRRWVRRMHKTLKIPIYGFCDCNPYGVSVIDTYRHHQGVKLSTDRNKNVDTEAEDSIEIDWIGLRPSQAETMGLPSEVFQELTKNDIQRLDSLLNPKPSGFKPFVELGRNKAERLSELKAMRKYKVELEALHWKGADYVSRFVYEAIMKHESQRKRRRQEHTQRSSHCRVRLDLSDRSYTYSSAI